MKSRVIIIIGIIVLAGLFVLLKPKNGTVTEKGQNSVPQPTTIVTSVSMDETNKTFILKIEGKEIVSGPQTIKVIQGDEVNIKITADEAEEFHIHGYDKFTDLEPNIQTEISFTADLSGRFPIELEHSKTDIAVIEVQPK